MYQILISIVAFIVALSILVAVHEFGHYWVARRLGVKILRFSIGFGKPLWRYHKKRDDTEFVLAAIPLGGYVKMLDEREGPVPEALRKHAFNNQPVWSRIAIVLAGPIFNFIFAVAVYTLVFIIGIEGVKPVVGEMTGTSSAASAGFQVQDQILKVSGVETRTWQAVRIAVLNTVLDADVIDFEVETVDGLLQTRQLLLQGSNLLSEEGDILDKLGLPVWWPKTEPIIDQITKGAAASKAGLQSGDRILSVNGMQIESWRAWAEKIRANPGKTLDITVARGEQALSLVVAPEPKKEGDAIIGFVGASVQLPLDEIKNLQVLVRYPFIESLQMGLVKTHDMIVLTFRMLGKLLIGDASLKNISGPISIAEYAGKTVNIDLSYFLDFLAIISISLGVLNLLPIPLLDGGHFLYYIIEIAKGSPVSEKTQMFGQQIGIAILGCLMMLAFYNDLLRLFGS